MDRRTFLSLAGTLAGGFLLPTVRGSPGHAEGLHARAQRVASEARGLRPTTTLAAATDLLIVAETASLAMPGASGRRSLHRTAALSALTAALAAQRAQRPATGFLTRARDHAEMADDGPLEAQALMLQRDEDGADGHLVGAGSDASVKLLRSALHAAGGGRDTASLRAGILYRLAWERAASNDVHGALMEMEGADASLALASASAPDYIEDTDLRSGGAAARRGKALLVAGVTGEAEAALAEALSTRLRPAGVLVDLAKARAAADDLDGAAAALEDGFLVAHASGSRRVETRVRAVASALPPSTATRELMALLRA